MGWARRCLGTTAVAGLLGGLTALGAATGVLAPGAARADVGSSVTFAGISVVKGYVRFASDPKVKGDVETPTAILETASASFTFSAQPFPFAFGCDAGGKVVSTDDPDGIARAIAAHMADVDGYVFDRVSVRGRWKEGVDGLSTLTMKVNTLVKFRGANGDLGGRKVRGRVVVTFDGAVGAG